MQPSKAALPNGSDCNERSAPYADMVLNGATPRIDINPETFEVMVNGIHAYVKPAERFALGQLYWFS